MERRRKDDDWIWLVAQLIGVLLLFGLISPQIRQMICAIGIFAVCALSIAVAGLIGFGIYRFVTRSRQAEVVERNVDWKTLGVDVESEERQPQTTTELIEQPNASGRCNSKP